MRSSWALLILAGCQSSGSIAAVVSASAALLADADRARVAIYARGDFTCALAYGARPDPIVPAIVVPIGAMHAQIDTVPLGEHVVIVDLFDTAGEVVGTGCNDTLVVTAGMTSTVELAIDGYPEVLAVDPAPRATFVSPARRILIVFSEVMDPASLAGALRVERSDGGAAPPIRDPELDSEDMSGRAWSIVPPFALDLGVEYTISFDPAHLPKSARGLPLRVPEASTFETDALADPFRDGLDALDNAVNGACDCAAIDGAKRVMERLFAPGTRVRIEQIAYIVQGLELARDGDRLLATTLSGITMSACATLRVEGTTRIAGDCLVSSAMFVIERECFCREVACESFELDRDEPACTDP